MLISAKICGRFSASGLNLTEPSYIIICFPTGPQAGLITLS